jgi:sRNA-binding regulator protein Hfq
MPASPRDLTLERYRQDPQAQLLLADGTALRAALQTIATYDFTLTDGRTLAKTACIGVFPVPLEPLLRRTTHPVHAIAVTPRERVNAAKIRALQVRQHLGCVLNVRLVNGWELEGTVVALNPYHLALQVAGQQRIDLFRHAIADYEIMQTAAAHPEGQALVQRGQQRQAQRQPAGQATPSTPRRPARDRPGLWQALRQETTRTMVNATLKVVLRDVPTTRHEVDGLLWIPLENRATAVPGGVELPPTWVDLLIPTTMWQRATTRAAAVQAETSTAPLYIVEALIGLKDGRLAAVARGVQVVPGKAPA